jgi:hypothetical protein
MDASFTEKKPTVATNVTMKQEKKKNFNSNNASNRK